MTDLADFLARHDTCVHVEIVEAKGSTPREAGAFMLVSRTAMFGTIGGGQLEFMAIDNARSLLAAEDQEGLQAGQPEMDIPLGPEIGQCCGGRTRLAFRRVTPDLGESLRQRASEAAALRPVVYLFGAGHVGLALARALALLPLAVTVIETRAEALNGLPDGLQCRLAAMPEAEIAAAPPQAAIVILTHDHALDFLIAKEALARPDLAYIGMIGSATKRATFASWLARETGSAAAMSRLTLPIGGGRLRDKRPAVIAALTATDILTAMATAPLPDRVNGHP